MYFIPNGFNKPIHDELCIFCNCTLYSHKFLQPLSSWKLQWKTSPDKGQMIWAMVFVVRLIQLLWFLWTGDFTDQMG